MAKDSFGLSFFNRLDARARILVLVGAVVGVIGMIYLSARYFTTSNTVGPSTVANAPSSLKSVPGGKLTAEYSKALQQANSQNAQEAKATGGSAVPTLMNYGAQSTPTASTGGCNVLCSDQATNVKYVLDDWVRQGKIASEDSTALQALANKNVSISEYSTALEQLLKLGKLTPTQARELLDKYKKQHANQLVSESSKMMDALSKSGKLPISAATQLLSKQQSGVTISEYAAQIRELSRQGGITQEVAQQLLGQYAKQHAKEVTNESIAFLQQLGRDGLLIPEVEQELIRLEGDVVALTAYTTAVQRYVTAGKLTPVVADRVIDDYKSEKANMNSTGKINQLLDRSEAVAYSKINDLVAAGKLPPAEAAKLIAMMQKDIALDDYKAGMNQLVQQGKLPPDIAALKIADYRAVRQIRDMSEKLDALQADNVSSAAYTDELKRQVQAGTISPEEAKDLLLEYQALTSTAPVDVANTNATDEFAKLQQRVAESAATAAQPTTEQFKEAEQEVAQVATEDTQAKVDATMGAMSTQAGQLISAWQPDVMTHKEGTPATKTDAAGAATTTAAGGAASATDAKAPAKPVIIKSGTIVFAVLDTTANSDYPDSPIMATIVEGPYKGAKLLGKLVTAKGISGQQDRISLNFTLMNFDPWPSSRSITCYAIDPDTARTVLATQVDYHYLQRFGAMMATSFLQGYANAITQAGTSTTGIFGTSTTHPALSPSQKIATALGQMGETVGTATANYINLPPTVKVDAGVGLGILFMSDVS